MNENEIFTEWIASQKKKLSAIASWPDLMDWQRTSLAIQSIKPFFYYRQEAVERDEDDLIKRDLTGGGRESGDGTEVKKPSVMAGNIQPSVKAAANPATTSTPFVRESVGPAPQGGKKAESVRVVVPGTETTRMYVSWLKTKWPLRWDKENGWWWGYIKVDDTDRFRKEMASRKIEWGAG